MFRPGLIEAIVVLKDAVAVTRRGRKERRSFIF
jgi:hypothetical protein